jgi:outer membrane receptor protein involved in Fe transport
MPCVALVAASLAITGPAWGQAGEIEEIIVTAMKREMTLQETPIAVSVVGTQAIKESQMHDIRDLPLLVPSLSVSQFNSSSNTEISIRGVGTSPFNAGLEPSVGIFVDGVYRSRAGAAVGDFPIIERIEVLRGPQSTIFGKNTSGGVISFITKKPQYETGADASLSLGNYNSTIFSGSVTGPISDKVAYRLSGSFNSREGYIDNQFNDHDVNDRNRWALRGQLLFEPRDDLSIRLIGDYSDLQETCCAAPPFLHDPVNLFVLSLLGGNLLPPTPFERQVRFDGNLAVEQELWGLSAQVDWSNSWGTFTSITAYRSADETNDIDADFVDVVLSENNTNVEDYTTFTQEFRLASDNDEGFNWMLGVYYFDQDLNHDRNSPFGPTLRPFVDLASTSAATPMGAVTALEQILGIFRGVAPGTYYAPGTGLQSEAFKQTDESIAVFANVDFDLGDRVNLSAGLRWATEDKSLVTNVVVDDEFAALDLQNIPELPLVGLPVNAFAGLTPFQFFPPFTNFTDKISEDNVSGTLRLSFDATDTMNLYASYSTGWKAGGFNVSIGSSSSNNSFDDESSESIEVGLKAQTSGGRLVTNIAVFDMTIDDFQANTFNGQSFDLANAGSKSITGFEIDAVITPTDNFVITAGATYLDDVFDSFEGASCINAALLPTPVPPELESCDPTNPAFTSSRSLSGKDDLLTPEWVASSTATWTFPLGNLEGFMRAELRYVGDYNPGGDQDPHKAVDAYTIINASVGIGNPDNGWDVTVWGKNITDEEYAQGIFNAVAQPGSLSGYPNDPSLYGVTFTLSL